MTELELTIRLNRVAYDKCFKLKEWTIDLADPLFGHQLISRYSACCSTSKQ
jgi:hypothetical protein